MDYWDFRRGGGKAVGGGGPRNCTKGKSCGATCIARDKYCWVNLPGGKPGSNGGKNLHDAISKVRDLVQSRQGGVVKPTNSPAPQTPKNRTEAQKNAALLKEQRRKEREAKSLQGAKDRASKDMDAVVAKKKPAGATSLSPAEIRKREKLEESGEAQRIMNRRQDATRLDPLGADAKAIRTYTSDRDIRGVNQYQNLNNCLRNPGACKNAEEAKKLQEGLDNALKVLPKNTDNFQFTRVISLSKDTQQLYDFLRQAKAGTILKDPGYGSFSSDKGYAAGLSDPRWGKTIKLVTRSGQIVPVNQYSNVKDEAEGILPRGANLKIARIVEDQNGITAFLDD